MNLTTSNLTNTLTEQNIKTWFSQPEQLHKNAIIERFWRTLALLLQRWRVGSGEKRWYKVLPDILENYNSTENRTLKASPIQVITGEKENPVERKQIETEFEVGDKVRIKNKKERLGKGDVETFSREIYEITEKKGQKNRIKNAQTNVELKRTYTDEELTKTWSEVKPLEKREARSQNNQHD